MVRKSLVPPQWMLEGEAVTILFAHGDTILYPLACVHLSIGEKISVKAAVSDTLPVAVLLRTDVELSELLGRAVTMEDTLTMSWSWRLVQGNRDVWKRKD